MIDDPFLINRIDRMKNMQIEGIATFTGKGFRFDSGLPSDEPVLDQAYRLRGAMTVSRNACVEFERHTPVTLPPQLDRVACGDNYLVRRSTRHYIIQIKVPVVESRSTSEEKIQNLLPLVMGEITLDRNEVLGNALTD